MGLGRTFQRLVQPFRGKRESKLEQAPAPKPPMQLMGRPDFPSATKTPMALRKARRRAADKVAKASRKRNR